MPCHYRLLNQFHILSETIACLFAGKISCIDLTPNFISVHQCIESFLEQDYQFNAILIAKQVFFLLLSQTPQSEMRLG